MTKSAKTASGAQGAGGRKAPATTPTVPSTPVEKNDGATLSKVTPHEMIGSALVGSGADKLAAATPRKAEGKPAEPAPSDTKPAAAAQVEAAPAPKKSEKTSPSAATQPVVVRKTGFWPVLFGGALAAGLGAGATIWALPQLPDGLLPVGKTTGEAAAIDPEALRETAQQAGAEAGEQAARDVIESSDFAASPSDELAALRARLESLEAQGEVAQSSAGQAATTSGSASLVPPASLAGLPQAIAQSGLPVIAAMPGQAPSASLAVTSPTAPAKTDSPELEATLVALQQKLDEQAAQIQELAARPVVDPAQVEQIKAFVASADEIQADIDKAAQAAQAQLAEVQSQAAAATQRAEAVASVAALKAALETGGSPEEALARLQEAGIAVPEPLAQPVPTLEDLRLSFDEAARAALKAALPAETEGQGAFGLVGSFIKAQTGARSVAPREGNDTDAVLSRARAEVETGNLVAALAELDALSAPAAEQMADWRARAQSYLDAEAALESVTNTLN